MHKKIMKYCKVFKNKDSKEIFYLRYFNLIKKINYYLCNK